MCDFGVSTLFNKANSSKNLRDTQGTHFFMAPECFNSSQYKGIPADIWSLGVTIYCFYFCKLPFYSDDYDELMDQILNQE